ncbi:hypothetical protein A8924_1524 [Saccharopolyspora erythraea NRRL 2338]|uniref:Uncharacterized protein n=2 Tax=Saccharopolyspora erythraea TaxID=1836 RepID=A4F8T3_SACEN|nr:hypothetical protein [Saccharopolyspora erythraea]EQD86788.1 hypothetical protein N599_07990 [Saccharopolyspora erythraea D]PFG94253.1 hypothetical protein A8924_1524 [Saccharopolyspora erythraea NRRL 2338]QRK91025.1 hypothetical protein JQX30_06165 [Saccharopolyspora erythraea]CAM00458.1 hypothetical protein SACE_1127 [Saccharopolyspora erythraea NRRL 2338]
MSVMHIVPTLRADLAAVGLASYRTYCGTKLRSGDGAPKNAPLCPSCARKAGWTHDKRK